VKIIVNPRTGLRYLFNDEDPESCDRKAASETELDFLLWNWLHPLDLHKRKAELMQKCKMNPRRGSRLASRSRSNYIVERPVPTISTKARHHLKKRKSAPPNTNLGFASPCGTASKSRTDPSDIQTPQYLQLSATRACALAYNEPSTRKDTHLACFAYYWPRLYQSVATISL